MPVKKVKVVINGVAKEKHIKVNPKLQNKVEQYMLVVMGKAKNNGVLAR